MDGRISNFMQTASIRRYEMTEGKERGLRVLDCDNGKLRFLLNESKALDVMQLYHEGQNVSFISKNGFTVREIPFAGRFEGGMVYTCGLDSVGGREGYELHGTLHNTPARVVRAECGEEGITVEAEIADTALFGKNLLLRRKIFSALGSERLEICDTLENRGEREEEYCLLYHVNLGYPMLDAGAELWDDAEKAIPRTPWAAEHIARRKEMEKPLPNEEEMCYFLRLKTPRVCLKNRAGKQFTLEWTKDTLPHFVEWKSMAAGDYALGLEPCTTELDDAFAYRVVGPGQTKVFGLRLEVSSQRKEGAR